ncbi:unnamed protein product [Acanthoscelides obtectus]|uniref:Uncharacterized protein n=1 Tax=Acanthoscelides obtectus TaxID=200917 RepID=A0A9P0VQQ7_ACAOB|nr:unnamed protein product [Acanthoscelides obtectus]CAK1659671.1 hypothetical protein AOBTE_LOCUS21609 [Acanthoscelides obtectus]
MCNGQQVGKQFGIKKLQQNWALLPVFGWIVKISTVVNAISSVVTVVREGGRLYYIFKKSIRLHKWRYRKKICCRIFSQTRHIPLIICFSLFVTRRMIQ